MKEVQKKVLPKHRYTILSIRESFPLNNDYRSVTEISLGLKTPGFYGNMGS